jgi:hypothetical protein
MRANFFLFALFPFCLNQGADPFIQSEVLVVVALNSSNNGKEAGWFLHYAGNLFKMGILPFPYSKNSNS